MILRREPARRSRLRARAVVRLAIGLALVSSIPLAAHKPEAEGPAARLSEAPASTRSLTNPFAGQAEAAAAGLKLYQQHCAQSHGPDGRGLERAADLHAPEIQQAAPGTLFWAIRNGRLR